MELIAGEVTVWPRITKLAKKKVRRRAAVAYISKGGYDLLPMSDGDLLVVDCTPASAKAGATDPAEIAKFINAGVQVHYRPGLHAKVFVFGNTAVIGSANASQHSANNLTEAILVTTERETVEAVRAFIDALAKDSPEVTDGWIDRCQDAWRPPKFLPIARTAKGAGTALCPRPSWRLWCVHTRIARYPEYARQAYKAHHRTVRRLAPSRYRLHTIGWDPRPAFKAGDLVIEIYENGPVMRARPPAVVEDIWHATRGSQQSKRMVTVQEIGASRTLGIARLASVAKAHGFSLGDSTAHEIRDPAHRAALLALWPKVQVIEQP